MDAVSHYLNSTSQPPIPRGPSLLYASAHYFLSEPLLQHAHKSMRKGEIVSCRDDLERSCAEYERDPAPILRHDPNISQDITTSLTAPSGLSYKDKAELYRIQTEEAWGRWLWLVAELIPNGGRHVSCFVSYLGKQLLAAVNGLACHLSHSIPICMARGSKPMSAAWDGLGW